MGFEDSLAKSDLKSPLNGKSSSSLKFASPYYDHFSTSEITSISELLIAVDDSIHCIVGTILKVNTDKGWYYESCQKCFRKLEVDGAIFYCTKCENSVSTPIARFRLELVVIDDIAPAKIMLFDRDAAKYLEGSANFLRKKAEQGVDHQMQHLDDFDRFFGVSFAFKVSIKLSKWSPTPSLTVDLDSADDILTPNQGLIFQSSEIGGRCLSYSEDKSSEDSDTPSSKKLRISDDQHVRAKRGLLTDGGLDKLINVKLEKIK
ncbi:uncharacterized protein G2W53_022196 [Senna tora]|uniref:Replication factor A C-terminal domain-containing protein n=1 Tax=Senna tora TaxID=362788 RepID=A0A834TL22_9FABA|nr:uncharacterized protein G2W53_022196 [Senna tora]